MRLIVFIFSIVGFSSLAHSQDLDPQFVSQAEAYARQIREKYPADQFYVLNYGVTTCMASAYLRSQGDSDSMELMVKGIERLRVESAADRALIFRIFDKTLPSAQVLKGRILLIHRVLWYGDTIARFMEFLNIYRYEKRPDLKLGAFFISRGIERTELRLKGLLLTHETVEHIEDVPFAEQMLEFVKDSQKSLKLYRLARTRPVWVQELRGSRIESFPMLNEGGLVLSDIPAAKPSCLALVRP